MGQVVINSYVQSWGWGDVICLCVYGGGGDDSVEEKFNFVT